MIPTRTFLFTDIEGSTRRWETFPAAMRGALARHDALLRAAIEGHAGTVFKTVGDAFCAVFDSATAAVEVAVAGQRALVAEDWTVFGSELGALRVRMGLPAGEVEATWFEGAVACALRETEAVRAADPAARARPPG